MSKLDEFLFSPQIRTSRNADVENQEPTGEVEFSVCQSFNSTDSDPEEASHSNFIFALRLSTESASIFLFVLGQVETRRHKGLHKPVY